MKNETEDLNGHNALPKPFNSPSSVASPIQTQLCQVWYMLE